LTAQLATLVRGAVDIDIAFARLQVGQLRVGQRGRALDRAGEIGPERHGDAGIGAGRGAAMDMRRGGRAAQPGIIDPPRQLL